MSRARKILMAAATFSVALGTGFVMQNGDALAARFGAEDTGLATAPAAEPGPGPLAVTTGEVLAGPALIAPDPTALRPYFDSPDPVLPVAGGAAPVLVAAAGPEAQPSLPVMTDTAAADALDTTILSEAMTPVDCTVTLSAANAGAGMALLDLAAPCAPSSRFTVHHQGMIFAAATDDQGKASMEVPALAEQSIYMISMSDGAGAVAVATVPEAVAFDRAILLWQGDEALDLMAYEAGAKHGEPGHVWSGAPRDLSVLAEGKGYLQSFGDPNLPEAQMAQVYTVPRAGVLDSGDVILTVEARITDGNCGRGLTAQTLRITPGAETEALDLTLTMPGCDGVGDILIMDQLLSDLTVASR